jgi:hypothetical protein
MFSVFGHIATFILAAKLQLFSRFGTCSEIKMTENHKLSVYNMLRQDGK